MKSLLFILFVFCFVQTSTAIDFNKTKQLNYVWVTDSWLGPSLETLYNYNISGSIIEEYSFNIKDGDTVKKGMISYSYDENDSLSEQISHDWDSHLSVWAESDKSIYDYDISSSSNTVTSYSLEIVSHEPQWVVKSQKQNRFDEKGYLIERISLSWSKSDEKWTPKYKYIYERDTSGRITKHIYEKFSDGKWIRINESEYLNNYTFDNKGQVIEWLWKENQDGEYINIGKKTYEYDESGYEISETGFLFDNELWIATEKYLYKYDTHGNNIEKIRMAYDYDSGELVNDKKYLYFYEQASGTDNETPVNSFEISLCPNPANDKSEIFVSNTENQEVSLFLYDLNGTIKEEIYSGFLMKGSQSIQFNTGNLPAGLYFIVARTEGKAISAPLLIVR